MNNPCPLCGGSSQVFYQFKKRLYHQCEHCYGIFMDRTLRPNPEEEKARYQEHHNNVDDKKYQAFVSPVTQGILADFKPQNSGLDFGAGTGPVIAKVLKDHYYNIQLYDPFFHDNPQLLQNKYDYIACCEVIEHFYEPKKEFLLLKELMLPHAKLYCMTDIYKEEIDFHTWHYKNDQTHVFIYHRKTLEWIKEEIGFSQMKIKDRLIVFSY